MWRTHRSEALNGSSQQPPSQGVNNRADGCMASGSDVSNGVSGIPGDLSEYATLPSHAGLCEGGPTNSLANRGTKMDDINYKVVEEKEVKVKEKIEKKKNELEEVRAQLKIPETSDKISEVCAEGSGSSETEQNRSDDAAYSKAVNDSREIFEVELKTPEFLDEVKNSDSLVIEQKLSVLQASNVSPENKDQLKTPEFLDNVKNYVPLKTGIEASAAEDLNKQDEFKDDSSLSTKCLLKIDESRSEDVVSSGKEDGENQNSAPPEKESTADSGLSINQKDVNNQKLRSSGTDNISEAVVSSSNTLNNSNTSQEVSESAETLQSEPITSEANTSSSKTVGGKSVAAEDLNDQKDFKNDSCPLEIDENRPKEVKSSGKDEIENSHSPGKEQTADSGIPIDKEIINKQKLGSSGTENISETSSSKGKDDTLNNSDSSEGVPTSAESLQEDDKISKQSQVRKNTLDSENLALEVKDKISGTGEDSSGLAELPKNLSTSEGCLETEQPRIELSGKKRRNQERWVKLLLKKKQKQAERRKLLEATNNPKTDDKTLENPDLLPKVPETAESTLPNVASSSKEKTSIESTQIENSSKSSESLENESEHSPLVKKRKISDVAEQDKLRENSSLTKEKESSSSVSFESDITPLRKSDLAEDENSSKQSEVWKNTLDSENLALEERDKISETGKDSSSLDELPKNLSAAEGCLETDKPMNRKQRRNHVKWLKYQLKKQLAEQNSADATNNPKTDDMTLENPDLLPKVPETAESTLPNVASSSKEKISIESTQIGNSSKPSESLENESEHPPLVKKRKTSDLAELDHLEKEISSSVSFGSDINPPKESDVAENEPTSLQIETEAANTSKQSEPRKNSLDSENLSLEDKDKASGIGQDSSGLAEPPKNLSAAEGCFETDKPMNRKQRRNYAKWKKKQLKLLLENQNSAEATNNPTTDDKTSENPDLLPKVPETAESTLPNVASSSKEKTSIESTQIENSSKPSESLENKSEQVSPVKKKKKSKKKNKNKGLQPGNQGTTQPIPSLVNLRGNGIGTNNTPIYPPPLITNPAIMSYFQGNMLQNPSYYGSPSYLRSPSLLGNPPFSPSFPGSRLQNQFLPGSLPVLPSGHANLLRNQGNLPRSNQHIPLMQVRPGNQSIASENIPIQNQNQGMQMNLPPSRNQVMPQSSPGYYLNPSTNEASLSRNELHQARIEEKQRDSFRNQSSMRIETNLPGNQVNLQSSPRDYLSSSKNEANTSRYQENLWNSNQPRNQENLGYPPKHQTNLSQNEANSLPSTSKTQEQSRDSHNSRDHSVKKRGCRRSKDSPSHSPHDTKRFRASERDSSFQENDLTRVIISDNYESLEIEELMYVRIAISHEIDKIQNGPTPRFNNTYLESGGIVVESADVWSRDWLIERVPKLVPWRGAKLRVVDPPDLEVFHRAVLWIPGLVENAEIVLTRLERQNPGLTTGNWRVYCGEEKFDPRGYNLIVGIPDKCVESLRGLDFKPYLGMSRVTITLSPSEDQKEKRNSCPRS